MAKLTAAAREVGLAARAQRGPKRAQQEFVHRGLEHKGAFGSGVAVLDEGDRKPDSATMMPGTLR